MESEVLIALLLKYVEDRLESIPTASVGPRGHRGPTGAPGNDGKDFVFSEHESTVRAWAKEFALKFSDLTPEEIETLKGKDGRDGTNFIFEAHREEIEKSIGEFVSGLDLKLKFSDLTEEEISDLRGPRGRDGKDGQGFVFEDHLEYFNSLKLKFSDLTAEERDALVLKFGQLTEDEKAALKLRFEDLTDDDRALIRGPRGVRGQKGSPGRAGRDGSDGKSIRGLPGPVGRAGRNGSDGRDGVDGRVGQDAPYIVAIDVDQTRDKFTLIFHLSDGTSIETQTISLPSGATYIIGGGGGGGGSSGGGGGVGPAGPPGADGASAYQVAVDAGFVGNEAAWLASLAGPAGPTGPAGADGATGPTGPQGIPGTSGTGTIDVTCDSSVFVGAAVVLKKTNLTEIFMSSWPTLVAVVAVSSQAFDVVAYNGLATTLPDSDIVGLVNSKASPTACTIVVNGETGDNYFGLDCEKEYFLSSITPGLIVPRENRTTVPGGYNVRVGQATGPMRLLVSRGDISLVV